MTTLGHVSQTMCGRVVAGPVIGQVVMITTVANTGPAAVPVVVVAGTETTTVDSQWLKHLHLI